MNDHVPTWNQVVGRYALRRWLRTPTRGAEFTAERFGDALVVVPGSGRERRISRQEYESVAPLIMRNAPHAELQPLTYNSAYLRAIVEDLVDQRQARASARSSRPTA